MNEGLKMQKGKIVKEIPNNLIALYTALGWVEYSEKAKEENLTNKYSKRVEKASIRKNENEVDK